MQKEFYGITQSSELPGLRVLEHKGVIWDKHLAGAQYDFDLTESFQRQAQEQGANAVIDVRTNASEDYFLFTGTAVVVELD